ncbi:MAG: PQQ-dependent sugar dehydrogenase [Pseudomonadota bacterium]|jgi:glucose/arabinose dehydrogenase
MRRPHALAAVIALACGAATAAAFEPVVVDTAQAKIRVSAVLDGLQIPWGLDFLPDGRALVTERAGGVRLADFATGDSVPLGGAPAVAAKNQGGMLDVLVHPRYGENGWIYLCHSVENEDGDNTTRVARYRLRDAALVDAQVLFTAEPWLDTVHHFGCRLRIDGDGYLFLSVGDRQQRQRAQELDSHAGKIMRLHDDGRVPADNPFVAREGAKPEIWSYGHRNVQGMAFDAQGRLWAHEHGPRGGDEVNLVRPGRNYGWPVITFGREYWGPRIGEGTAKDGMQQPALQWTPSIAPSGMLFYSGDALPAWRGQLFSGALVLTHLNRATVDGEKVAEAERILAGRGLRIRDVEQDAQGLLYLLTDNGFVLRIEPAG